MGGLVNIGSAPRILPFAAVMGVPKLYFAKRPVAGWPGVPLKVRLFAHTFPMFVLSHV